MYTFKTNVRYSEFDSNGNVRPEAIVNLLQDCTTFHSESLGATGEFCKAHNKVWVLNAWQIEIKGEFKLGDEITVATWPYDFSGAFGLRNLVIQNKDGQNIVEANAVWVFADIETGRPVKLTEEFTKFYTVEEKLDMDYVDRKVALSAVPPLLFNILFHAVLSSDVICDAVSDACAEKNVSILSIFSFCTAIS